MQTQNTEGHAIAGSHRYAAPAVQDTSDPRPGRRSLLAQLSAPARQFLSTEAGSAGLLLAATLAALLWANSPWSGSYEALWRHEASVTVAGWQLAMDFGHWVNDALMALFFFVIGLEVRREFSVGELTTPRRAAIPVIAAIGGLVVPALLYLVLAPAGEAARAWGVVIGTDTAFLIGALAVVGPTFSTQLRIFLLTLTVIDDIVAVSVIGLVYSDSLNPVALVAMAGLGVLIATMSRYGVSSAAAYLLTGLALWIVTVQAGLHASIAGMLGGLLVAAHEPRQDAVERAARRFRSFRQSPGIESGRSAHRELVRAVSVNERMQTKLHPVASYVIVPLFAFANAGIDLRDGVLREALGAPLTWAVVVGLVAGKLVGISAAAWVGVRSGAGQLPTGVHYGHVLGGAALSGIGFTVSLLIAGLAFTDPTLHDQAVVGVLIAAVLATLLGWLAFRIAAAHGHTDADVPRALHPPVDPRVDAILGPPDAPHAELAAHAAVAAQNQGRLWDMHDQMFTHQHQLGRSDLAAHATRIGLDVERFLEDLDRDATAAKVRADVAGAEASGARGTPTFFVGGRRHVGPHDTETLARALEASRTRAST